MGFFGQDKSVPLSSAYKVGTQYPLDVRQTVESEEDLWSLSVWGSYKSLKKEWGFSMYPNMLVGIANTNIVYQLNGSVPQITDKDAVRFPEGTWHKIATQEWVAEQGFGKGAEIPENTYDVYGAAATAEANAKTYADEKVAALYTKDEVNDLIQATKDYADNNDADTKYGIEYDADNKTIKLVEGGTETEIDASDFIKDGMLSSVVADQDNNKLTFYWNTAAGIETTEIALSSIADIYTGVEGDDITVSVSNENKISATLAEGIKTAIGNGVTAHGWGDHAQAGYAKTTDLGALASKDSLSASDIGAYTKEEVNNLITNEFQEIKIINPNGEVKGTITFDGTEGSHLQASTGLIADAFGANKSVNEISLYENTCYAKDGIKIWLPENSDYYSLKYPSSSEKDEEVIATQEWVKAQGYGTGSGGGADLTKYATKDWVEDQGFVTASYLNNVLTFTVSGDEASAVSYSNDEVLFTENLYVTNPMGDFVNGDNVKGLSLQEIITRLLKLETNI